MEESKEEILRNTLLVAYGFIRANGSVCGADDMMRMIELALWPDGPEKTK
jgi:hypothetical protein